MSCYYLPCRRHLCVRVAANKKMVACITAVPVLLNIKGTQKRMVEINFLCVHKKLRSKRLAPVRAFIGRTIATLGKPVSISKATHSPA